MQVLDTSENSLNLKSVLLAGAAATALTLSAGLARASEAPIALTPQDTAEDAVEGEDVVVVTGIRRSIADSIAAKRNSTSIIEAVSAEDIGKLPDLSIADSLARLPGLTAQRVRGRSQSISIRGLGPDFSISLLNGREQVSSGDNRGIEFDQFPAELIAQGLVYKTPDASLAASGIAGTVDLRTINPLDYNGAKLTVSGRYVWNDNGEINPDYDSDGYRLFGSYIDQNDAGTLGWYIAVTDQSNPNNNFSRELKTANGQTSLDGGRVYPSDNPRTGVESREFKRTSVAGAIEWEPNETFAVSIDAFYSDFEDAGVFRGLETPLASWSTASFAGSTGSGVIADSATYNNVNPVFRTDVLSREAELFSGGINATYKLTEKLILEVDLSNSQIERNDIDYESYAGFGNAGSGTLDTLTFNNIPSGEYMIDAGLDYADPTVVLLTDPGGWGQVGFYKEPTIEDEINQFRAEVEYLVEGSIISSVELGGILTNREKSRTGNEFFVDFAPGVTATNELQIPANLLLGAADLSHVGLRMVAYDPQSLLSSGIYTNTRAENSANTLSRDWTVEEDLATIFLKADIDTLVGEMPLRGNIGFQQIFVEQSSTGASVIAAEPDGSFPVRTEEDDYTHFLPTVNLSLEFMPDWQVRFGYAKTVSRPRMNDMRASVAATRNGLVCSESGGVVTFDPNAFDPSTGQTCFTVNGGNTFLRPFEADAFDVSLERYFGEASAISIAYFYKDTKNFIVSGARGLIDISGAVESFLGSQFVTDNPDATVAAISSPLNLGDGEISGFEAALRLSLDPYLPDTLRGFGFNFSYSYTDATAEAPAQFGGGELQIPGFSENVYSADVYYENHGVRARLNLRHRSEFLAEIETFSGALAGANAFDETILDGQLGYTFQGGPLEGLAIIFEAYNLTDERFGTFNNNDLSGTNVEFPSRYELYGRTYSLQISKSF